MSIRHHSKRKPAPAVFGTGLLALDLVIGADRASAPRFHAGGTCGNVLAILSYLGWSSYPVARLSEDHAGERLLRDLRQLGVHLDFACLEPPAKTPIIVEWIAQRPKEPGSHRFSFSCPICGAWFPGYRAVCASSIAPVIQQAANPKVFFFDRVSRAAIMLATHCASKGAVIVFEPAGIGEERLFREAIQVSHILKYSSERLGHLSDVRDTGGPVLEIETLGAEGLRYRSTLPGHDAGRWQHLSGYTIARTADTAGAGDWLTAALISKVGESGARGFLRTTPDQMEAALRFGQAAAAWNCQYEGARGGMYSVTRKAFLAAVSAILTGDIDAASAVQGDRRVMRAMDSLCSTCGRRAGRKSDALTRVLKEWCAKVG